MASVYDVAQYINEQFGKLSRIKLQKLLYFCQAWHLAMYKKPLFQEDFYAWEKGPVVVELHNSMHHIDKFVPIVITNSNIDNITDDEALFIDKILSIYGDKDKNELVDITHQDTAWSNVKIDDIMTKDSIQECYEAKKCPIQ